MHNLLFEIGTEEIPAGYIDPALQGLALNLKQKLNELRIEHGDVRTFGTPRRLGIAINNIALKQKEQTTEITGPPKNVGFDAKGNPTMAARKFAEKVGIAIDQITIKDTSKGQYLCAKKTEAGQSTEMILSSILPSIVFGIPFPKTMKWADFNILFARPIHSILALLDNKIIPFKLDNVKSCDFTFGHRFAKPEKIKVEGTDDYIDKLREAFVLVDIKERKERVYEEISKTAKALGGHVLKDEELVSIVNNLVEYPVAAAGRFDTKFLELPGEILITAMREHQKYFAVVDDRDQLLPCFIAVNNTPAKDMSLVAKGHERVLRARLTDAQFFYQSDLKANLDDWVEKLKGVLFQAKLGSVYEKVLRVQKLSEYLFDEILADQELKKQISRAAYLCKADLVSHVVGEFPKLQGIMGRVYAKKANEEELVANAIEEHYRPTYSGGKLPETLGGAILAICDKIDSLCGCFSANLIPTGASDPYALRRQGIGIIQIILDKNLGFSLNKIIKKSISFFGEKTQGQIDNIASMVYGFLQSRIVNILSEQGFSKDVIAAVTNVTIDHVPNIWKKVDALEKLKAAPDFEPLAIAFKRVVNIILKKADQNQTDKEIKEVDEKLFQDECEKDLLAAFNKVNEKVAIYLEKGSFDKALLEIASLKKPVDAFFDGVMVMTEDVNVRQNRISLLKKIADLFGQFADFSKIST